MKKLLLFLAIIIMSSCSTHQGLMTAKKHQKESVKANKKQAKGLRKASLIVNAEASQRAYGKSH